MIFFGCDMNQEGAVATWLREKNLFKREKNQEGSASLAAAKVDLKRPL